MNKQLTVIGTNHGKNVSRIWIEGKRLVRHPGRLDDRSVN